LKRAIRRIISPSKRVFFSRIHSTVGNFSRLHLSSKVHGDQYENYLKLMLEGGPIDTDSFQYKILNSRSFQESWLDSPNVPLIKTMTDAVSENPELKTCIDLGSGTGWVSNMLSEKFSRVVAIEPSASAIEISKHHFGHGFASNIEWKHGFAEKVLLEQNDLTGPIFVFTGVVLSHTPNRVARKVLKFINENLALGSAGLLIEAWGSPRSESLWHIRSRGWWQENLSNCDLDFFGPERENMPGEYLGLKFKKIK
jgi:SAM-dependent methyltransferase